MSAGEGARTYTFLYTDIVGSSRLWESDPHAMASAVEAHNALIEAIVEENGGRVFKSLGDGLACVFDAADRAVACAVSIQRAISGAELACPIDIRIGIHSGTAHAVGRDFGGPVLNRVSRITDLAEGGQIFITEAGQSLAQDYVGPEVRFDALGEVVLEGMNRPEKIFCVRAEGLRAGETFGGDTPLPPSNIERLERPFIGRVAERKDLAKRLRDSDQRLITVVGFGGMGKTTLARQCGLDVREDFAGCAYWIECEPIRGREELAAAALAVLGEVSETADSEESLVALIRDKRVLLIFDCFENIVTLGGFLDRLVRRCPNLKVLVTSRIVLGAEAEYLVELGGMSGKQSASVESDAVELFLSHTARHSPAFGLKQAERTLVRRLVRDLEYVPLAIVICAGRLRYTPIKALHEQIKSSLLGTVKSVRDQAGRHSGLARVIQMSFDLLDDEDQRVLVGLALFEGSFTMEAAISVLGEEPSHTRDCVHRLRDHSLVSQAQQERMILLDSVREFLNSLEGADNSELMRRFSAYYELLAGKLRALSDAAQWVTLASVWRSEATNLRAAIKHTLGSGGNPTEIALPVMRVLLEAGRTEDLLSLAHSLFAHGNVALQSEVRLELLGLTGTAHRRRGQLALARENFLQRADLCREIANGPEYADSLLDLAVIELESNHFDKALSLSMQVKEMGATAGDALASSLAATISLCYAKLGDKQLALQYLIEADKLLEQIPQARLYVNKTLSLVLAECGEIQSAVKRLSAYTQDCVKANHLSVASSCLVELALLLHSMSSSLTLQIADLAMESPAANQPIVRKRLKCINYGRGPTPPVRRSRGTPSSTTWAAKVENLLSCLGDG